MKSKLFVVSFLCMFLSLSINAQNTEAIVADELQTFGELMDMDLNGGKPFMDVLKEKHIFPHISDRNLEPHHLSGLLLAANGTPHRGDMHNRTAFAPMDVQCITLYVLARIGIYLYDAETHKLKIIDKIDARMKVSEDHSINKAPVILLYVINPDAMSVVKNENLTNYAYLQAGSISQNVFLFCSSEDMATNVILDIKKEEVAKRLNTKATNLLYIQAVGYRE